MHRKIWQRPCATISIDYVGEGLWSKKPVEDGVGETVWFEFGQVIQQWLDQAKPNANKRPSEAR
ncbi:hypothetical protein PAECIP111893_01081 [Paenibacillus plantiphilus]|uniref:Uncharacterized protein n=1 Tax=Paenibacillus plantiphilus TaxID=2905650 RepID=A0ABN8G390_9BACL|nr:hypothetical protein [Paenibacillus plantiphilus]CAH1198723.1 hypothetical protein PAECIP111893_01081 [Paenibacillus plantiphilus]